MRAIHITKYLKICIIMGTRFKTKCPKCGAYLIISETNDCWPGCKEREEAFCPKCGNEVYSSMTSGFVNSYEITEEEFNNEQSI